MYSRNLHNIHRQKLVLTVTVDRGLFFYFVKALNKLNEWKLFNILYQRDFPKKIINVI